MLYYHIDSPSKQQHTLIPGTGITFRGWMTHSAGNEVKLLVSRSSGEKTTIYANEKRPDVVAALAEQAPNTPALCGFCFEIVYEELTEVDHTISLSFTDGTETSKSYIYQLTKFTSMQWPSLTDVEKQKARADYKAVWNNLSGELDDAKFAVAGYTDDAEFHRVTVAQLKEFEKTIGINPDDVFLEIGCGVGRVATQLADRVSQWIGTDVSENMLKHAADILKAKTNVKLVPINGWDLAPIPSNSIDAVYCSVVFMHLDEWERFNYICEAKRVLRPGGRIYVNNFNLLSDEGWQLFHKTLIEFHPLQRPPFIGKSSTAQELTAYLNRAGFDSIETEEVGLWVSAWAKYLG